MSPRPGVAILRAARRYFGGDGRALNFLTGAPSFMNRFHNWYCRSSLWRRTIQGSIVPWVLSGAALGDEVLEVGPGPGLTTDIIKDRVSRLTAIEYDSLLADRLRKRLAGTNVTVVTGDATQLPFEPDRFSAVASFTMLHHVPSITAQDALLREAFRVLQPGGLFLGSDSRSSLIFRAAHLFDTMVLVDPGQFGGRLEEAGFREARVDCRRSAFRFSARKPVIGT